MKDILRSITNFGSALVVGDVMLDRYLHGTATRISPEAPVPVVRVSWTEDRPGGAANVAANMAALGVATALIGVTGDDDYSRNLEVAEKIRALEKCIKESGVFPILLRSSNCQTLVKTRIMHGSHQMIRADYGDVTSCTAASSDVYVAVLERFKDYKLPDVLVLSDYDKGTLTDIQGLITLAKKYKVPVVVAPKNDWKNRCQGADVLVMNQAEYVLEDAPTSEESGVRAIVMTASEHGMTLIRPEDVLHLPSEARNVVDVTGAGDTVTAVMAASVAAGISLEDGARLASRAAGIVVGKLGTSVVTPHELYTDNAKILTIEGMVSQNCGLEGRVVLTNGCFDMLHSGHVSLLQRAKQLGDHLIVLVNSDASINFLKGHGRPHVPLSERMEMLAALECVDYVVPFDQSSPEGVIERIKPNVLVKGADYKVEDIKGSDFVKSYGGSVVILPRTHTVTSTELVKAKNKACGK